MRFRQHNKRGADPRNTLQAETTVSEDPEKLCSRRISRNGRTVILPPEGHGERWSGGA